METLAALGAAGLLIALGVVVVVASLIYARLRYKKASPDKALIVVTRRGKKSAPVTNPETGKVSEELSGQKVVLSGGVFIKPIFEEAYALSLSSRKIPIRIQGAVSKQGIRLNLDAVAIVKVGGTEAAVRAAAQRFLSQEKEIESFTQEVLAGSLRAIVGTLTVDEIIRDRAAFASKVEEESATSLQNQGLVLDTFQIQDVNDDGEYLRDLGRPEAAAVARNAAIAEAKTRQEAAEQAAIADAKVAEAERNLALRRSEFKADQDKAAAAADAAGRMARAQKDQEVLVAEEQVAERQANLTERRLDTEVRKPADAARYQAEQEAQARRNAEVFGSEGAKAARVAEAEAEAEAIRTRAAAELERRKAEATATQLEGEAEAAATLARGEAEAAAMRKKAEAFEKYGQAALAQMIVDILPQMAREVAAPLSNVKDMTIISNDGAGKLAQSVGSNMQETLEVVKKTTGLDLVSLLGSLTNKPEEDTSALDN